VSYMDLYNQMLRRFKHGDVITVPKIVRRCSVAKKMPVQTLGRSIAVLTKRGLLVKMTYRGKHVGQEYQFWVRGLKVMPQDYRLALKSVVAVAQLPRQEISERTDLAPRQHKIHYKTPNRGESKVKSLESRYEELLKKVVELGLEG
jgi:hypothetical protein